MMSQELRRLVATSMTGTFQLQLMLQDRASELEASLIQRKVNAICEEYKSKSGRDGTPVFTVQILNRKIKLLVHTQGRPDPIGEVPLRELDGQLVLDERKSKPRKRVQNFNNGMGYGTLKTELAQYRENLPQFAQDQLDYFLAHYEAESGVAYCYDLDATEEGITIVAYREFKRCSAITLFY